MMCHHLFILHLRHNYCAMITLNSNVEENKHQYLFSIIINIGLNSFHFLITSSCGYVPNRPSSGPVFSFWWNDGNKPWQPRRMTVTEGDTPREGSDGRGGGENGPIHRWSWWDGFWQEQHNSSIFSSGTQTTHCDRSWKPRG